MKAWKILLLFIVFTPIGTLTHELGHYLVARSYGIPATITYRSTRWDDGGDYSIHRDAMILMGGPVMTILTGTIAVVLLIYFKFKRSVIPLDRTMVLVMFTFSWSRPVLNGMLSILHWIQGRNSTSDEAILAQIHGLPAWLLILPPLLTGIGILLYTIIYFIPKAMHRVFVIAGISGSIMGWVIWFYWLGPLLLPE